MNLIPNETRTDPITDARPMRSDPEKCPAEVRPPARWRLGMERKLNLPLPTGSFQMGNGPWERVDLAGQA